MSTEILESHLGGPLILDKYVKTMEGYDENNLSKMTVPLVKSASDRLLAYLYLENSDQDKYGSILKNVVLRSQPFIEITSVAK